MAQKRYSMRGRFAACNKVLVVANSVIEKLRGRVPYIRRLHKRIDELQHQLATIEAVPDLTPPYGSEYPKIVEQFREFLRLLQPHDVAHARKRRFGGDNDGGYIMLEDLVQCRAALSLGIGPEVSWDADMAGRGLRIIQFDHTVDRPPQDNPRFVFNRARVVGRRQSPDDLTLSDILARRDLADEKDLIAKVDIEGWEWEVLAQTTTATLSRIRQLAIEFHGMRKFVEPSWRATALSALKNLMHTHACIHIHGNNWVPFTVIGGIPFPSGFEATFARRSDYAFVPSAAVFPTDLDRPCNPKAPDHYLGSWSY
jgi:hypothetical protein